MAKNNKFFSFLFYVILISISAFFIKRLIDLGIEEALLIIPADIGIILVRRMYKKHGKDATKMLFNRKSMTILFMSIAVFISFMTFIGVIEKNFLFFRWTEYEAFSISPSLISTLAAILLYLSVVVRNKIKLFSDAYETTVVCLNVLFCASFLELFFPKEIWSIPFINISSQSFLMIAVILSWIGMRAVSGFVWIFLFILAVTRIAGLNIAMGTYGVIYILSAFISIGLQLKDSVHLLTSLKNDFIGTAYHIGGNMRSSINMVKSTTGSIPTAPKEISEDTYKELPDKE
jgi:hypothetical protein